jgi:hypothetical protein
MTIADLLRELGYDEKEVVDDKVRAALTELLTCRNTSEQRDVVAKTVVEITVSLTGKQVWVNVDGQNVLRISTGIPGVEALSPILIADHRPGWGTLRIPRGRNRSPGLGATP